jgi:actin-related protein 6
VGGKLLTNYLKELVSYRQWNMMDEFLLMNQVKQDLCYLSMDLMADLTAANTFTIAPPGAAVRDRKMSRLHDYRDTALKKLFVLPDFHHVLRGYIKGDVEIPTQDEQVLSMEIERFCVPELLFRPSDIGIDQAGIAESTWQSLSVLADTPSSTSPAAASVGELEMGLAASHVVLTGGNARFPQFREVRLLGIELL